MRTPTQKKDVAWQSTFETAEILLLKERAGSKTRKIAEPATDDDWVSTATQDHIQGGDILQDV